MPCNHRDRAVTERIDESDRIAHHVQHAEGIRIGVVGVIPTRRPAVAALIRRNDVIAGIRQRQHDFAPAIGELGKAVRQEDGRTAGPVESGFEDVHGHAVHVRDEARSDACRDCPVTVRRKPLVCLPR